MNGTHNFKRLIVGLLLSGVVAVASLGLAADIAHADDDYVKFQSPSGNIRCAAHRPAGGIWCQIRDYTYVPPRATACQSGELPRGNEFQLGTGGDAYMYCPGTAFDNGPWPTLDYGQTISVSPFTCDSEPSGMTCTDSGTGHFFRVSRDSYQLG